MTRLNAQARELDSLLDSLAGDDVDLPFLTDAVLGRAARLHNELLQADHAESGYALAVHQKATLYAQAIVSAFGDCRAEAIDDA